jgi:carboxypeptidase Taq
MTSSSAYKRLEERFRKMARLSDAQAILLWDEAVMMPSGSSRWRNESAAELATVIRDLLRAPEASEDIVKADGEPLSEWEKANLREMKRQHAWATTVPSELQRELTIARMECEQAWRSLRKENDWKAFYPLQERVLKLTREELQHMSSALSLSVYDTALSQFSPGLSAAKVDSVFHEIKEFLPGMIGKIVERQKSEPRLEIAGRFPEAKQKALGKKLMEKVGFSFEHGRLDESHHPFCGGTPRDIRITTRYREDEFISSLMGVLHETGHGLYEMNLPIDWYGQPVGTACGMAIHESQSLLMEMQVSRSREFVSFLTKAIRDEFKEHVANPESLTEENLWRHFAKVSPGFIRVDADEVTYPLHVMLRFEIERELLEGRLALKDLPEVWDEKMTAYLGLSTKGNDRDGCMQDVHWPSGTFGYFPAYTFGAVIAAQLFQAIRAANPGVMAEIAEGNLATVQAWLRQRIWSQGSKLTTLALVEEASGPLSTKAFREHLESRYFPTR